jgi:hypothetical protein
MQSILKFQVWDEVLVQLGHVHYLFGFPHLIILPMVALRLTSPAQQEDTRLLRLSSRRLYTNPLDCVYSSKTHK